MTSHNNSAISQINTPQAKKALNVTDPRAVFWTNNVEMIFLVGCPRSGTTWLQAMLSSHPTVYTGPETQFFFSFSPVEKIFNDPADRRLGISEYLTSEEFYGIMANLFKSLISRLPHPETIPIYFLEKTPHHCQHFDFILKTFPNARFIHLVRDGRAVVSSLLRVSKSWGKNWAPNTIDKATQMWLYHVRKSRAIRDSMGNGNRYLEVKYEELRQSTHLELRRIFEWLGLPAGQWLISGAINSNSMDHVGMTKVMFPSIKIPGANSVKPVHNSLYPDGFIGSAVTDLRDIELTHLQGLFVERKAGDLLRELGYADVKTRFTILERVLTNSMTYRSRILKIMRYSSRLIKVFKKLSPLRYLNFS